MIPGSRGRSARSLRAVALGFVAGLCVALPAVCTASTASAADAVAAPAGTARQVWQRAWSWDGSASTVPEGCAATAGGGMACTGRPLTYARVVLRARLPRVRGAVTRIALGRAGLTLPASAAPGTHTFTLTWSPAAVTLAVDGDEVYRGISYAGPRRLAVTVTSERRVPAAAGLLVEGLDVEALRVGVPVVAGAMAAAGGSAVPPPVAPAVALPGPVGSELPGRLPQAVTALQTTTLGASWPLGGTCVAVGVLLGVLRAALVSRRRPLA